MTETQSETPEATPAAPPKEPLPVKVTAERRQPGSLLILSLELPGEEVASRVEKVLEEFRREAAIPGFRKGRAPMDIVRRRLGKSARGEAVSRLIPEAVEQVMAERKLESLAEPKIENLRAEENAPITCDLVLEVRPEITLPPLGEIAVSVEERPVTDERVEQQLEAIRRANALLSTKEGAVAPGDAAVVDIDVTDHAGQEAKQFARRDLLLRTGEDGQSVPPEVVEALPGHAAGDHFTVPVQRTIRHPEASGEAAEQKVTWTWRVAVKEVKSVTLPDLDDEFAKDLGDFDSLEALRARIRADLEASEESRVRDAAVQEALGQILARTTFDAPASLVAQAQVQTLLRDSEYLRSIGRSFSDLGGERTEYWETTRQDAERKVRADLVIEAIGEQAQITVTDEDIEAEIARLAQQAGRKPLAIRAQLEARNQMGALRDQLRRRKIADHLLAQIRVSRHRG